MQHARLLLDGTARGGAVAMREPLLDEVTGTGIVKAAERGDEAVVRTALSGGVKADAT